MTETIVLRQGLRIGIIVALRAMVPALVASGMLYVIAQVTDVEFDSAFVTLTIIVAILGLLLLQPPREAGSSFMSGRAALVLRLFVRWAILLSVVFAIGYATKSSQHFCRQVVLL